LKNFEFQKCTRYQTRDCCFKDGGFEMRKIHVPPNRFNPLKENWMKIYSPIVEYLKLQIRFNLKSRNVEIKVLNILKRIASLNVRPFIDHFICFKTCKETTEISGIQKAADFVKAFVLGFEIEDALALIRLDDLFLESFEVIDGKLRKIKIRRLQFLLNFILIFN
jgi:RNA-binding protein PNO1